MRAGIWADPELSVPVTGLAVGSIPRRQDVPAAECPLWGARLSPGHAVLHPGNSVISEPRPVPSAREAFPDEFGALTTSPSFLFFVLHAG